MYTSNLAFYYIVFAIIFNAPAIMRLGILEFFRHKSYIRFFKLLKGESNTAAQIFADFLKYSKAVTAPIDRPQIATLVI